ncbi:alpha/beta fold hydrolase [Naumannella halotolerans]|uniref:Pimeloyl-ACP methyl ester carboxylesterase n=1 Tax=Naumannella halotolerans TaxID=993414 RepID=A0A4R7JCI4_9ACTN|nr:alpha/beta hydrolase [Naumannella halotolerans]TDT34373.1 pimeloyl-ACP methyl ester carboxylesterase [Naumannella halotolerans]
MDVTEDEIGVGRFTFRTDLAGPPDGAPVLLLHGFPASKAAWREVIPALVTQRRRVIAPDQRGYSPGARPAAVDDYDVDALVDDVIGLLDALGIQQVTLGGHDWGAIVAWFVAVRHPDRVDRLVAVSVPHPAAFGWALRHDAEQQQASAYMKLFRIEGKAEDVLSAEGARRLRAMYEPMPADLAQAHLHCLLEPGALTGALNWYRAMRDYRDLGPVTLPTTFLWGADDTALRRAGAERCGDFVDAPYRFVELPGVGHWVPELAADRVAQEILDLG